MIYQLRGLIFSLFMFGSISREKFHSLVLSLDKMVRDGRQLIKGGSVQKNLKQLQQHVGMKPSIADCLDGLQLLYEMHQSEYA